MKKLVALVLSLCLMLGVVSFASADEPVVISVYRDTFNLANPDSAQVKKVEDAINAYIADKINVKIELHDLANSEYVDKANLALANNEINLLWTASWESTIGTNDLVPAGAVYDITDLLPGTALYASMDEGQWEATKYNGKNYFIPVYKDNVEGYDFQIRTALLEEKGWDLSSVKELKDIEPFLEEIKDLKYPYLTGKTAMFYRWYIDKYDFFTADANTNFFAIDRATGEVVDTILTEDYAEFCKLMGDWAEKGYISEDEATKVTSDQATQTQDWGFNWWTDIPVNQEASQRANQDITVIPITNRYAHSTSALGSCYCVTANSTEEQAKAAIDFMGLLYTDTTLADMYTFGIEGEDFEYVQEEGQAVKHVKVHSDAYWHSMWESASATVVSPLDNEPDNKADLYKEFNGSALTSLAAGFRFDKSPVEAAYTACANLFDQYGFALENGAVPADAVDAYIADYQSALDGAGYQDVLAEFTNQWNTWKAAQ